MFKTILTLLIVLGLGRQVRALPDFPEEVQKATQAPCLPHCNLCHRDDNAGDGTVDRPFGVNMRNVGYLGGDKQSVAGAVSRLRRAATDSDGDGVPDIEELTNGDDPNSSYDARLCGPQVGCQAQGGGADQWGVTSALLLGLVLLGRGLRRTRRADSAAG